MSETEDAQEGSGRGVGRVTVLELVLFLLLTETDVGGDDVVRDGFGDGGSFLAGGGDEVPEDKEEKEEKKEQISIDASRGKG